MSLLDFQYISSDNERLKLKQRQEIINSGLKDIQEQNHEKEQQKPESYASSSINFDQFNTHYLLNSSISEFNKPYDPICTYSYDHLHYSSQTPSSLRERTPSMISSSSHMSEGSMASSHQVSQYSQRTSTNYNLTERDDYGFKRSLWIIPAKVVEFERAYKESKEKQSKRWNKLFLNNDQQWPTLCPQLNRYVQKGIPQKLRAKAWMHYSGAQQKMSLNQNIYQSLLNNQPDKNEYIDMIQKKAHRLLPDNIYFYDENYQFTKLHSLRRVLTAFTHFSPEIGYSQSLGLLAAFILLVIESEEEAFWLFVTIVHDYFPKDMFDPVMDGARIEQTVFMQMVYEKMPGIWSKIASKKCFWEYEEKRNLPQVTLLSNHWFLTMFVNTLPVETSLRIWDCALVGGGFKVIHQVALTLFKLNDKRISSVEDSVEALQILQSMPKQLLDCDKLIDCIFSSTNDDIFDITTEDVESKRGLFRDRKVQREMKQGY